jgi:mono/diheme cytochrome c family protein
MEASLKRGAAIVGAFVVILIVSTAVIGYRRYFAQAAPPPIADELEHFKYGSIGAEVNGFPYSVWRVLPTLFAAEMPNGWGTFGFIYESGRALPVGISVRKFDVERVGFNCATCHTSTIDGGANVVLGAPANRLDLQGYVSFLARIGTDERFTADAIVTAIKSDAAQAFDVLDELVYRTYIIPKLKEELANLDAGLKWTAQRPAHGPGRTDAGNPWRQKFGLSPLSDNVTGAVDFPPLWNQALRTGAWLHWDGNNNSLTERNLSAALAGGASVGSLDHASIERVAAWSMSAPAPRFPAAINADAAARGRDVYKQQRCGECHDADGMRYGRSTPLAEIGTDPERFQLFTQELLDAFGTVGAGRPWQFRHYKKSEGYANIALDGIWARAPYLHNGSIPTLYALLLPAAERPKEFQRGCDRFDAELVGFVCQDGFRFDTTLPGNRNVGHEYGTALPEHERSDLLEYLKTL